MYKNIDNNACPGKYRTLDDEQHYLYRLKIQSYP